MKNLFFSLILISVYPAFYGSGRMAKIIKNKVNRELLWYVSFSRNKC